MVRLETIKQYNEFNNHPTLHPLATVVNLSKAAPKKRSKMYFGIYLVVLKQVKDPGSRLRYGNQYYDFDEGTLVFIGPGQILQSEPEGEIYQPAGMALAFHPDFIKGASLGRQIHDYSFFSYQSNEALHLSEKEKTVVLDCLANIDTELNQNIDKHSKKLIISNIELLLNYCTRFYDRQFITRSEVNKGIIEQFETLLNSYIFGDQLALNGLPSVAHFASELHLSANYFGDLIKKEIGKSALELIQLKILDAAKERTLDTSKTIAEISYSLGFKYPQHFTRFFKLKTGYTPVEYRLLG